MEQVRASLKAGELFSERERQIMVLMLEEGLDDREIATTLGIKAGSVKMRRKNIYTKIGRFLGYRRDQKFRLTDLALFAVTHELVNMRTIIDRYSPVTLASQHKVSV